MFSVQSVLGFILGFAAAVFILILCAPPLWRRALFLAQKVVRTELPLSLKEVEADRDFLRARHAVAVCRLQEELDKEREDDQARKLALSRARERLHDVDRLEARCKAQQAELENRDKKIARLEEQMQKARQKAEASLKLKNADLQEFRRQIKAIAARTAGFIAAQEGRDSPILQIVAAEAETLPAAGSLAAAIAEQAALARQAAEAAAQVKAKRGGSRRKAPPPAAGRAADTITETEKRSGKNGLSAAEPR